MTRDWKRILFMIMGYRGWCAVFVHSQDGGYKNKDLFDGECPFVGVRYGFCENLDVLPLPEKAQAGPKKTLSVPYFQVLSPPSLVNSFFSLLLFSHNTNKSKRWDS